MLNAFVDEIQRHGSPGSIQFPSVTEPISNSRVCLREKKTNVRRAEIKNKKQQQRQRKNVNEFSDPNRKWATILIGFRKTSPYCH
jgi:hypothetical protein